MKQHIQQALMILLIISVTFLSCQKEINESSKQNDPSADLLKNKDQGHLKQTKTFSSEVVIQWLNQQLNMLRVPMPAGTGSQGADRCQAYCGIALYEAVVPGMPAYQSLSGQLTDFPEMPKAEPGKAYHWAASANAALAEMNRKLFPTTADANKTAMNALESTLEATYAGEVSAEVLQRSVAFGKEVATRVFAWAATDGSANVNPPYVPPVGPGLWVPTPPPPAAINPYAFQRRLLVPGVKAGTELPALPAYSTDPASPFYAMVKNVYDKSLVLTDDQKAMAVYHRDNPGYPGGGHFVSILSQVFSKANPMLDLAALSYASMGIAQHDATIILFTDKYTKLVVRPITYIRNVMGHAAWSPHIPTPNHPEYPSGHATTNGAALGILKHHFGANFQITLHTYDYLPLPSRSYNSFDEMSKEMADSRVYGGIHYQTSCDNSLVQGKQIAANVISNVKFLKE
ncbi:MAG TPA: vanadium-dependent haloperoxidase [Phnomibacter sp.]|nr:vanadium-dependent haloperoxidase [Phnomibacter sp.]